MTFLAWGFQKTDVVPRCLFEEQDIFRTRAYVPPSSHVKKISRDRTNTDLVSDEGGNKCVCRAALTSMTSIKAIEPTCRLSTDVNSWPPPPPPMNQRAD